MMNWNDPNERKQYNRNQYLSTRTGSFDNRLKDILYSAKARAKKDGAEFTLTQDTFKPQSHCRAFGEVEFDFNGNPKNKDRSMSIDRIDPTKGYTPDNVWLICWRANRIKNDATLEELEAIVKALKELKENE